VHLIARRYSRSGYAPAWFYAVLCIGFAAMAVWALAQRDWLVGAIAIAMVPVTIAGSRVLRRLSESARAERSATEQQEDEHR
jgi:hypothetical protein